MSDEKTAPHYQLEAHDLDGWKSLGPNHAFYDRHAANSDLRLRAAEHSTRLRIRETTSNRIVWMRNTTAYDEELNNVRDNMVSLRAEYSLGLGAADAKQTAALHEQIHALDGIITAIDKIF